MGCEDTTPNHGWDLPKAPHPKWHDQILNTIGQIDATDFGSGGAGGTGDRQYTFWASTPHSYYWQTMEGSAWSNDFMGYTDWSRYIGLDRAVRNRRAYFGGAFIESVESTEPFSLTFSGDLDGDGIRLENIGNFEHEDTTVLVEDLTNGGTIPASRSWWYRNPTVVFPIVAGDKYRVTLQNPTVGLKTEWYTNTLPRTNNGITITETSLGATTYTDRVPIDFAVYISTSSDYARVFFPLPFDWDSYEYASPLDGSWGEVFYTVSDDRNGGTGQVRADLYAWNYLTWEKTLIQKNVSEVTDVSGIPVDHDWQFSLEFTIYAPDKSHNPMVTGVGVTMNVATDNGTPTPLSFPRKSRVDLGNLTVSGLDATTINVPQVADIYHYPMYGVPNSMLLYYADSDMWVEESFEVSGDYAVRGVTADNGVIYHWMWGSNNLLLRSYDTATDTWNTITGVTDSGSEGAASSRPDEIYFANEWNDNFYKYVPSTDTFTQLTRPTMARTEHLIYNPDLDVFYALLDSGTIHEYNPNTDTWTLSLGSFSNTEGAAGVAYLNGKIYWIGGFDSGFNYNLNTQIFDVATQTISTGAPLSDGWKYPAAEVLPDGRISLHGGTLDTGDYRRESWIYDPVADSWDETPTDLPVSSATRWSTSL